MNETWKDVKGYEGIYQVSDMGGVKRTSGSEERILKPYPDKNGYKIVSLHRCGIRKVTKVHRLVGQCFIPNPTNLPFINHKDETPSNNNVLNLEWCDRKYNNSYGMVNLRKSVKEGKAVVQKNQQGETMHIYHAATEAERKTGIPRQNIGQCCMGKIKTAGKFIWAYADASEVGC